MNEISICGAVDLLAKIYGKDKVELRAKYGLPLPRNWQSCLHCNQPFYSTPAENRTFCSAECKSDYTHIPVACSECGCIFYLYQTYVISRTNRKNQQLWFCSRKCHGKWLAQNHGFAAHPENAGGLGDRKWDRNKILHLRLDTGWGAGRIGKALNIPVSTVSVYLRRN